MATREQEFVVVDNPDASRYELTIDGVPAGFVEYRLRGDTMVLPYIEIDPAFGGRGFGGRLAQAALDDARARGLKTEPTCPFIRDWVRAHPEYAS